MKLCTRTKIVTFQTKTLGTGTGLTTRDLQNRARPNRKVVLGPGFLRLVLNKWAINLKTSTVLLFYL